MDSLFPDALNSKSCTNCGETKSSKLFHRLNEWCRQCLKEARENTPPGKGFCADCKAYLPLSEFDFRIVYSSQVKVNGEIRYSSSCKKCHSKRAVKLSQQKYDATVSRDQNLQKNHGITLAEFNIMLADQGGVCAICKLPERRKHAKGEPPSLAVDHDHKTGKVRGLLCVRCNHALGCLDEDPVRLRAMIEYILVYT